MTCEFPTLSFALLTVASVGVCRFLHSATVQTTDGDGTMSNAGSNTGVEGGTAFAGATSADPATAGLAAAGLASAGLASAGLASAGAASAGKLPRE